LIKIAAKAAQLSNENANLAREIMNKVQTNTRKQMSMTDYVQYRNGVPLGASGSLQNMLFRSLGAGTFAKFWQYWNPIWGYALGRYVYEPLNGFLPSSVSLILTFIISGGIHDFATMLVRGAPAFFFTPWFFFMAISLVVGRVINSDYSRWSFPVRVMTNLTQIVGCFILTIWLL
jgi:hypothetical protein